MSFIRDHAGSSKDPAQVALFVRLYSEHRAFVRRVLLRHGVPERDVEDTVQQTFLTVLRRLTDLDPTSTPRPWIHVIAVHTASNYRARARHRREELSPDVPEPTADIDRADDILIEGEEFSELRTRISRLRPKLRAVLIPYILEGRLISEITAALKLPAKTVYARLRLSRQALMRSRAALRSR
jgi:RNA polymerase sigma-70 factor, ECF subfamily